MTKEFTTLTVQRRTATGKGVNRRLRAKGIIPAVFYISGGESMPVQVAEAPLRKIYETVGRTAVFNVEVEDNDKKITAPALLWDIEFHPTKNRFLHVDLFGVDLKKDVKIRIPLEFTGTAKGTKLGGILEPSMEFLDLIGKPLDIPSTVTVDVTGLDLGEILRVCDLALPEGVRAAANASTPVIAVGAKSSGKEDSEEGSGE